MGEIPCIQHACGHLESPSVQTCDLIRKLPESAAALLLEEPCKFRILIERMAEKFQGQGSYQGRHEEAITKVQEQMIREKFKLDKPTFRDLRNLLITVVRNACLVAYRCEHCWYYSRRHCDHLDVAVSPRDKKVSCEGKGFGFARERTFLIHVDQVDPRYSDTVDYVYRQECIRFFEAFDSEAAEIIRMLIARTRKEKILKGFGDKDPSWLSKKIHGRKDTVGRRRVFTPGIRQKVRAFSNDLLIVPRDGEEIPPSELEIIQRWSKRWEADPLEYHRNAIGLCLDIDYRANSASLNDRIKANPSQAEFILDLYEAGNAVLYGEN